MLKLDAVLVKMIIGILKSSFKFKPSKRTNVDILNPKTKRVKSIIKKTKCSCQLTFCIKWKRPLDLIIMIYIFKLVSVKVTNNGLSIESGDISRKRSKEKNFCLLFVYKSSNFWERNLRKNLHLSLPNLSIVCLQCSHSFINDYTFEKSLNDQFEYGNEIFKNLFHLIKKAAKFFGHSFFRELWRIYLLKFLNFLTLEPSKGKMRKKT